MCAVIRILATISSVSSQGKVTTIEIKALSYFIENMIISNDVLTYTTSKVWYYCNRQRRGLMIIENVVAILRRRMMQFSTLIVSKNCTRSDRINEAEENTGLQNE